MLKLKSQNLLKLNFHNQVHLHQLNAFRRNDEREKGILKTLIVKVTYKIRIEKITKYFNHLKMLIHYFLFYFSDVK